MQIPLTTSYEEITQQLDQYIQKCAAVAADTAHGYKKKEAALRADGATRLWIALFAAPAMNFELDAQKRVEDDLVRLRKMVQNIPTDDQT